MTAVDLSAAIAVLRERAADPAVQARLVASKPGLFDRRAANRQAGDVMAAVLDVLEGDR